MKPRELRVGNLVNYKGIESTVIAIGKFGTQVKNKKYSLINAKFRTPDLCGISLTEEWLNKLGFNIDNDYLFRSPYHKVLFSNKAGYIVGLNYDGSCNFYPEGVLHYYMEVKYVHRFQNIYFEVTDYELEIIL